MATVSIQGDILLVECLSGTAARLPRSGLISAAAAAVVLLLLIAVPTGRVGAEVTDLQPVPSPLHSAFKGDDAGEASAFSAYFSALLAQNSTETERASAFYSQAFELAENKDAVGQRAFYQLVYAGHIDAAAEVAGSLTTGSRIADDLVSLVMLSVPFRAGNWADIHQLTADADRSGLGAFLLPIIDAWGHAARGEPEAATDELERLAEQQGFASLVREQHAYIADFMDRRPQAAERYKALVNTGRPASLQPFVQYAAFLERTEGKNAAKAFLQELKARFPDNRFLMREGAQVLAGRGLSLDSTTPEGALAAILYRLSSEFVRSNSRQIAVFYLRVAEYLHPTHDDIKLTLGAQFEELEDFASAARVYAGIDTQSPMYQLARQRYVTALQRDDDRPALRAALARALSEDNTLPSLRLARAELSRQDGAFAAALEDYNWLIKASGGSDSGAWYLYFARGVTYDQLDRWEAAEADLLRALALKPDDPTALNYLGYSWIDRDRNHEQATLMIRRALDARPEDGFINDSLGWVYFLQGDYGQAITYLERAVSIEPGDAVINDHLGDAYWRAGRHLEARYQWRQVLEQQPDDSLRAAVEDKIRTGLPAGSMPDSRPARTMEG